MKTLFLGHQLLNFPSVSSTNDRCWELMSNEPLNEGAVVWTQLQTDGKGQRGKSWYSEKKSALTFSIFFKPKISTNDQFFFNKAIALGLCDGICSLGVNAIIKWPNDVYIRSKKVAGILIENNLKGGLLLESVVGIGVNVNHATFPEELPNPISLEQALNQRFQIDHVLEELCYYIEKRYLQFKALQFEKIETDYEGKLYKLNEIQQFTSGREHFEAVVLGVDSLGKLKLLRNDKIVTYSHGELSFVS